jgi:hypothetical protein
MCERREREDSKTVADEMPNTGAEAAIECDLAKCSKDKG